MTSSGGGKLALALGALALILLAVVAVVVARRPEVPLDPSSPEGTVQRYVQAVLEGDEDGAWALASASYQADLERRCRELITLHTLDLRVSLLEVETTSDAATVHVRVTESGGEGPFDRYEFSNEGRFELVGGTGSWAIDQAPYQFEICPRGA